MEEHQSGEVLQEIGKGGKGSFSFPIYSAHINIKQSFLAIILLLVYTLPHSRKSSAHNGVLLQHIII